MLNWKDPKVELPKAGTLVWVITQHWKEHNPRSCEIICGEVQYTRDGKGCSVDTMDFTGKGSYSLLLKDDEEGDGYLEEGIAWLYCNEMPMPEWVEHDSHWGPKDVK